MRLIDADALGLEPLTPDIDVSDLFRAGFNCAAKQVIEAPTIDPVHHGYWIVDEVVDDGYSRRYCHCSECGKGDEQASSVTVPFCWFCGAKMDES